MNLYFEDLGRAEAERKWKVEVVGVGRVRVTRYMVAVLGCKPSVIN